MRQASVQNYIAMPDLCLLTVCELFYKRNIFSTEIRIVGFYILHLSLEAGLLFINFSRGYILKHTQSPAIRWTTCHSLQPALPGLIIRQVFNEIKPTLYVLKNPFTFPN
jgi:hypothetical protein